MPPLRGSIFFSPAYRGFRARCALHPRLCYVTAMRFCVMPPRCGSRGLHPRLPWVDTHGCGMPPLRGSIFFPCIPWVSRTMCAPPTAVLCHRDAVRMVVFVFRGFRARCAHHPRWPWVCTHGCVMPPQRGSDMNDVLTVGFATPSAFAPPTAVLCHRDAVLCYVTATRFRNIFLHTMGFAHDVRVTHGCVMTPRRGSVLCHPYGVYEANIPIADVFSTHSLTLILNLLSPA